MKIRVCFEIDRDIRFADGTPAAFGVELVIGESATPVDYQELTEAVDKVGLLRTCCLDSIVKPEDIRFITPEEYDLEYGDDDEDVSDLARGEGSAP